MSSISIILTPSARSEKKGSCFRIALNHENAKGKRNPRKKQIAQGIAPESGFFREINKYLGYLGCEYFVFSRFKNATEMEPLRRLGKVFPTCGQVARVPMMRNMSYSKNI